MDGSLGHFKDIIQRRKARVEKAESRFDKKRLDYKVSANKTDFNFPKLKTPELEKIKSKIRFKAKIRRYQDFLLISVIGVILLILFYYILT